MRVLMVVAHPDDEVLFGWPLLQTQGVRYVYAMTHNASKYGAGPIDALREVVAANDAVLVNVPRLDTNVYRLPTRGDALTLTGAVKSVVAEVRHAMTTFAPDAIFTHNPMGEYGHGDHRLLFNAVSMLGVPMLLTDICFSNACHVSSDATPAYHAGAYACAEKIGTYNLNIAWYRRMRQAYVARRAWSWSGHEPVQKCSLFLFK